MNKTIAAIHVSNPRTAREESRKRSSTFVKRLAALSAAVAFTTTGLPTAHGADEYWRTDGASGGTWTSTFWNIGSPNATGGTGWTSGNNALFTADSALTFATSTVGDVSVSDGKTVTVTANQTLTLGGVRTFDIGTGALLTWISQGQSAAAGNEGAGIIKNGAGTLSWGAGPGTNVRYNGGFTLNAGTVIVTGANALTSGALTLNGGTLQSTGGLAFTSTSLVIGGDFALAGTGNTRWDDAITIALGSATRTITNSIASGSRQFRGLISGASGAGLTLTGAGAGQLYIGNTGNTFDGPVSVNGGAVGFEVVFNGNGAFGNSTSITIDGGRLTMGVMDTSGNVTALTAASIASSRNIFVGDGAGTSISISGATGVTTYDGVIADKPSETGSWAKQGAGRLELGGVSTYTGSTSINNGIVRLTTGNDRLPTGTTVNLGQAASSNLGTLDLNGRDQTIAGLVSTTGTNSSSSNNTVTTSAGTPTLTLGGSGTYGYGDGTNANSGIITGAISLAKTGSGTQTLGDENTYTGGTTISNGTLFANNTTGSATGTGAVAVNAGGTLGGAGFIGGPVTVTGSLAPGNSAGTLTVNNSLTLSNNSFLKYDLSSSSTTTGGGVNDLVRVLGLDGLINGDNAGVMNLGSAVTVNITSDGALTNGNVYTLAQADSFNNAANLSTWGVTGSGLGSHQYTFGISGNSLTLDVEAAAAVNNTVKLASVVSPSSPTIAIIGANGSYDGGSVDITDAASGTVGITGFNPATDGSKVLVALDVEGVSDLSALIASIEAEASSLGLISVTDISGDVPLWVQALPQFSQSATDWEILLSFASDTSPYDFSWNFAGTEGAVVDRVGAVPEPGSLTVASFALGMAPSSRRRRPA